MKPALLTFLMLIGLQLAAQNNTEISNLKTGDYEDPSPQLNGLWLVQKVTVGEEELTPVAKWFEFSTDGTQKSGNGWLQNYEGTWRLDAASNWLYNMDMEGNEDPYGPFTVRFSGDEMTWRRVEDGMTVVVSLTMASKVPLAPWDKIVGRWTWVNAETEMGDGTIEVADFAPMEILFRWDNEYQVFNKQGVRKERGIWQINAHRPFLRMVPNEGNHEMAGTLSFEDDEMTLTIQNEVGETRHYFKKLKP